MTITRNSIPVLMTSIAIFFASGFEIAAQDVDTTWTKQVEVTTGPEEFNKVEYFAYSTLVYETSKSQIKSLINAEVEARSHSKSTSKQVVQGDMFSLAGHEGDSITALAQTENMSNDIMKVSIAFLHGDRAVSPDNHADKDSAARAWVYNLGVLLNKSVVASQITDAEQELELITKKRDAIVKEREGLDSDVRKYEMQIVNLEADSVRLQGKMIMAQAEAESAAALAASSPTDAKAIKKSGKAKDKAIKAERAYLQVSTDKAETIAKINTTQAEMPVKDLEIEQYNAQIEQQKAVIAALNRKYDAVK